MGNSPSNPPKPIEPPVELHVFKGLQGVPMEYSIPEIPEKRRQTDQFFSIFFIVFFIILGGASIYTLYYSDLKRITNGYDNCGNVCGENNDLIEGINCTGKDYTNEKILLYKEDSALVNLDRLDTEPNECVSHCDQNIYFRIMNRCFKMSGIDDKTAIDLVIDQQIVEDLKASYGYIIGIVFIALGICFVFLLLFKYFLDIIVKTILITTVVLSVGITIILWRSNRNFNPALVTFSFIISCIVIIGVLLTWRRINFVIRIFNETTKALFAMPFLLLVPIWVFLIEILLTALLIFLLMMYYATGILTHLYGDYYTYYPNGIMIFTIVFTIIFYIYLCAILHGCQQVIVAGAISTWYFTREKDNILGDPIKDSCRNLIKYHFGSVAFGSLVITMMKLVRIIVRGMTRKRECFCFRILFTCCIDLMEEYLHYISNQAYIMIAMHGQPFISSGKRATKLLLENCLSTLSVNSVGDFVLWITKVLVIILTCLCGIILDDGNITFYGITLFIGICLAALLAHSFFQNFEICVDTIFLCYCEDTFIHDGIENPYYAPVGLVAVVEEAKNTIEQEKMYNSVKTDELPQNFV